MRVGVRVCVAVCASVRSLVGPSARRCDGAIDASFEERKAAESAAANAAQVIAIVIMLSVSVAGGGAAGHSRRNTTQLHAKNDGCRQSWTTPCDANRMKSNGSHR